MYPVGADVQQVGLWPTSWAMANKLDRGLLPPQTMGYISCWRNMLGLFNDSHSLCGLPAFSLDREKASAKREPGCNAALGSLREQMRLFRGRSPRLFRRAGSGERWKGTALCGMFVGWLSEPRLPLVGLLAARLWRPGFMAWVRLPLSPEWRKLGVRRRSWGCLGLPLSGCLPHP